jgi:hypothetical protein
MAVAKDHVMVVRVPDELYQQFARCADARYESVSQVVRGLMKAYADAHGDVINLVEGKQQ